MVRGFQIPGTAYQAQSTSNTSLFEPTRSSTYKKKGTDKEQRTPQTLSKALQAKLGAILDRIQREAVNKIMVEIGKVKDRFNKEVDSLVTSHLAPGEISRLKLVMERRSNFDEAAPPPSSNQQMDLNAFFSGGSFTIQHPSGQYAPMQVDLGKQFGNKLKRSSGTRTQRQKKKDDDPTRLPKSERDLAMKHFYKTQYKDKGIKIPLAQLGQFNEFHKQQSIEMKDWYRDLSKEDLKWTHRAQLVARGKSIPNSMKPNEVLFEELQELLQVRLDPFWTPPSDPPADSLADALADTPAGKSGTMPPFGEEEQSK